MTSKLEPPANPVDDLVREFVALRDRILGPIVDRLARWLAR